MTTTIASIQALPTSPYEGTGFVGIVITSGVPSYFKIIGNQLDKIVDVTWYPTNPASVKFITRQLILVDANTGTFMIKVTDNFLYNYDRGGRISFRLDTGQTITFPVVTYGPVSAFPLWSSPSSGLVTG